MKKPVSNYKELGERFKEFCPVTRTGWVSGCVGCKNIDKRNDIGVDGCKLFFLQNIILKEVFDWENYEKENSGDE